MTPFLREVGENEFDAATAFGGAGFGNLLLTRPMAEPSRSMPVSSPSGVVIEFARPRDWACLF